MVAQVSIGVLLLVIIRSLGEYFRLQYLHGDALVIGQVTPYVAGALFAAVALAVTVTSYFAGLYRISIALAAATAFFCSAIESRSWADAAGAQGVYGPRHEEMHTKATLTIGLCVAFLAILSVLHVLEPEFNPPHLISEYQLGRFGWLMSLAFFCLGAASLVLFAAARQDVRTRPGLFGTSGLLIIGVAYFCAGIFPPDPKWFVGSLLHGLGGLIVIFGSPMVFTLVSKGFIRNETSATIARLLICTAALTWLSLALFYGSIVAFGGAPRSGSIMVGWTNRILIMTFVLWLLVAAFHVRRRSSKHSARRSPRTIWSGP